MLKTSIICVGAWLRAMGRFLSSDSAVLLPIILTHAYVGAVNQETHEQLQV